MSSRLTLAELTNMPETEVSALSTEQIATLLEEVAVERSRVAALSDRLQGLIHQRYAARAAELRSAKGVDTGRVRIPDGEVEVVADLPKSVVWDQAALRQAAETFASWGEPVEQYLSIKYSVPESRFNAWPDSVRSVVLPARTLSTGRPTYTIERKDAA